MEKSVDKTRTQCPPRADLRAFGVGQLPETLLVDMAEHLAGCSECESALETLGDSHDTVATALHELDRWGALFDEPGFKRLQAIARELDITELCGPSADECVAADVEFSGSAETSGAPVWGATDTRPSHLKPKSGERRRDLPEKIDRYFVLRRLGGGGFGDVYLAKDPELNRKVAIKVPRRDRLGTEESVERFLAEARTAAELEHPAIVQVYDWGRQRDGTCFVVMEYIEGHSLKEVLKTERLEHRQAAEMIAQAAEGLHEAHKREIYHRDIKPANILIDREGKPHIADFGLAIHEDERWAHKDELAGTFAYMSPEQVRGEAHMIDGRTDIWSLGIILYEVLTGSKPFSGGTHDQLRDEILHKHPRPMRMIDGTIAKELDDIGSACLAKPVADRMATASDLAASLHAFLQPAPALAPRARRWPKLVLAAAGGLAAVVIIAVAILSNRPPSEPASSIWRATFPNYKEIVWPGFRGYSDIRDGEELVIIHGGVSLVQLSELKGGNHRFSVRIRQPEWNGRVGVFLGYRVEEHERRQRAVFQLIWLEKTRRPDPTKPMQQWPVVFQIRRTITWISTQGASTRTLEDLGVEVVPAPGPVSNPELEIEIEGAALKAVRWDGKLLEKLGADSFNEKTDISDYVGPWGLYHEVGSSSFGEPMFESIR